LKKWGKNVVLHGPRLRPAALQLRHWTGRRPGRATLNDPVPNALTPPPPSLQLPCLPAAPGTIPLVLAAAASTRHSVKGRLRAFPSQEDHALIVTCGQQHFRACRTARTGAEVVKKSHCVLLPQHDCSSGGYVRLPTSRLRAQTHKTSSVCIAFAFCAFAG
jgi:hypothetical protein